jgi:putative membrane protein
MNRRTMLTTATAVLATVTTLGLGPLDTGAAQAATRTASFVDTAFILEAAQSNQLEIALGTVARQKAQNADVKAFAAEMVKDHTQAEKALEALATKRGVTVPAASENPVIQALAAALAKVPAADFDFQYVFEQVNDHTVTLALVLRGAAKAQDPALRSYFRHVRPVITEHLKEAQALLRKVKPGPDEAPGAAAAALR